MLVAIAAVLMVSGMVALVKMPVLGMVLIGIGYACYSQTTRSQRSETASVFFGICLVSMIAVGVIAAYSALFK